MGQSILESYSRILESLAFNILSRIDDVLHVDNAARLKPYQGLSRNPSVHTGMVTAKMSHFTGLSKSASTHVVGTTSPTRSLYNKPLSDYVGWSAKAPSEELKQGLELLSKSPPPLGESKQWAYAGNLNAMQSPPSRD